MNENKITEVAKTSLDAQADRLSSDTQQRLRLAREKALEVNTSWSHWLSWKWIGGASSGIALASVIAFMIVPNLQNNTNSLSPLEDLELLTAEVDMDLVDHLEFYQWLDENLNEPNDDS